MSLVTSLRACFIDSSLSLMMTTYSYKLSFRLLPVRGCYRSTLEDWHKFYAFLTQPAFKPGTSLKVGNSTSTKPRGRPDSYIGTIYGVCAGVCVCVCGSCVQRALGSGTPVPCINGLIVHRELMSLFRPGLCRGTLTSEKLLECECSTLTL